MRKNYSLRITCGDIPYVQQCPFQYNYQVTIPGCFFFSLSLLIEHLVISITLSYSIKLRYLSIVLYKLIADINHIHCEHRH